MSQQSEHEEDVFTGKIDFALWRRILKFAVPYKRQVIALVCLAATVAGCDVMLPLLTGWIINAVQRQDDAVSFWKYGAAYFGTFVVLASCVFGFIIVCGRITVGTSADIRAAAFDKLQRLPFAYFDKRAVGWLMARLTSDCNNLSRMMAWGLLDVTWGTLVIASTTTAMFILNWRLALIVSSIVPLLMLTAKFFQTRLLLTQRQLKKTSSLITGSYNEAINGVRTTKSLVREEANLAEFDTLVSRYQQQALRNAYFSAIFIPCVGSICSLGIALALWYGGYALLYVPGTLLTIGTLVTFLQYAGNIQGPAQELANTLTMVQGAQASAERVQGLLDEPVTIRDSSAVLEKMKANAAIAELEGDDSRPRDRAVDGHAQRIRTIVFRNVTFAYLVGQPVLSNFNLVVNEGETIALVGATGGGKSTIVSLLCRFYEPTEGQILFDGVDYRERSLDWLQSNLGIVLQQPHLFSGTIRENIRYGRLTATDDEVVQAARLTNAAKFIDALKTGYDTPVGEGGNQLSTGQKQLVALARAVIAQPQIFVMDEATSSVDTQTERDIQTAVEQIMQNRISFVIAHRLSTIRNADQILVIDGGKVIESGSHHDLIRLKGRYFELYTNQFTVEQEEKLMTTA
jgi:ATP-binding cassette, subfamily B, bacterial